MNNNDDMKPAHLAIFMLLIALVAGPLLLTGCGARPRVITWHPFVLYDTCRTVIVPKYDDKGEQIGNEKKFDGCKIYELGLVDGKKRTVEWRDPKAAER